MFTLFYALYLLLTSLFDNENRLFPTIIADCMDIILMYKMKIKKDIIIQNKIKIGKIQTMTVFVGIQANKQ